MTPRAAVRLAWTQEALAVALLALSILLVGVGDLGWQHVADSVVFLPFTTVGLLVAARHPRNPIGWLLCGAGQLGLVGQIAEAYARHGLARRSASLPGVDLMAWLADWVPPVGLTLIAFAVLLFPDGRLPSRRWRPVAWLYGGTAGALTVTLAAAPHPDPIRFPTASAPFGITGLPYPVFVWVGNLAFLAFLAGDLACVAAMPLRLRRARGDERAQLKWVTYATVLVGVTVVTSGLLSVITNLDTAPLVLVVPLLPVAVGVAIFKYRLYDIDSLISKTLAYTALVAFIAVVYVAVLVGVGSFVGHRAEPHLAVSLIATAVVAVAFQPVRERVERLANRLVYGTRVTPYQVLAAFSQRIEQPFAAQELPALMARMLAKGTGATQTAVWLVVGDELRRAASWPTQAGAAARIPLAASAPLVVPGASRTIPVQHQGQLLGALTLIKPYTEPPTPTEDRLLADLAARAAVAFRNIQLIEQLRASRQRIVARQDAERRRLERDIHDGAQQRLVTLALALRMARIGPDLPPALSQPLDDAGEQLTIALTELRELARGIYPPVLADEGLGPALAAVVERSAIPAAIVSVPVHRLPAPVEATAYLVVTHALADATQWGATSVTVNARHSSGRLVVEVAPVAGHPDSIDADGAGFPSLHGLADRIAALDGRLDLRPRPDSYPTATVVIPCESC